MRSSPLVSRAALGHLLAFAISIDAQSAPGGRYFAGSGAPGAASYQLVDDYQPAEFFSKFTYFTDRDPTWGHVQYVNGTVAALNNYTSVSDYGTAIIKPETAVDWPNGTPGIPSVRITSANSYYHGLFIFDATHIPTGCGTWPAYWLLGPDWPYTGEIDIIEGVHTSDYNTMSLHTSSNCSIAGSDQTGKLTFNNCYHEENDNAGCGSELRNSTVLPNNYGAAFNDNGGGVYVTEWTSEYIKHWFFPRGTTPPSITKGQPNVTEFGIPAVNAQGACDIDSHFQNMSIVINIDFCGAWAGNVYQDYPSCPQPEAPDSLNTCVEWVGNNAESLVDAYWDINRIQVYQMPAFVVTTSAYSTSLSSITTGLSTNTIPMGLGATTTTLPSVPAYTGPILSAETSGSATVSTATAPSIADESGWVYSVTPSLPVYSPASSPMLPSDESDFWASYYSTSSRPSAVYTAPPVYYTTIQHSEVISTSVSTWSSDGETWSSTVEITSTAEITPYLPSELPMTFLSPIPASTVITGTSTDEPSLTPIAPVEPAPPGCTPNHPTAFQTEVVPVGDSAPAKRSHLRRQAIDLYTVFVGVLKDENGLIGFIAANSALQFAQPVQPGAIFTGGWSVCSNGSLALGGTTVFYQCVQGDITGIYYDSSDAGQCTAVTIRILSDATSTSASNSATVPSASPAPPCPTTYDSLCGASTAPVGQCTSSGGENVAVACGIGYYGTTIPDDQVTPGRAAANIARRYDAPDYATCQAACDSTQQCIAVTFQPPNNCTLFSTVTGTYSLPGAVGVAQVAALPSSYFGSSSAVTTTQTQTIASVTTTVTGTSTAGLPTTTVSASVVTVSPTSTVVATLPSGGSLTSVTSGSSTDTYYIFTSGTPTSSLPAGTGPAYTPCFTCGLEPIICLDGSNCGLPTAPIGNGTQPATTPSPILPTPAGTCPRVVSGTGYVTIHTTYTYTSCLPGAVCPNPGYIIIGGGGSMTSRPGQEVVTTTNNGGSQITYTQIPTGGSSASSDAGRSSAAGSFTGINGETPPPYASQSATSTNGNGVSSTGTPTGPSTELPNCPYSDGSTFIDPMGESYVINCDKIFSDMTLDIQTIALGQLADCINSCDAYNMVNRTASVQCEGVSFYQYRETDNCLLKAGTTASYELNVHSARLVKRAVVPGGGGGGGGGDLPSGIVTAPNPSATGSVSSLSSSSASSTLVAITTVTGAETSLSTYVTTAPGGSTIVGTSTIVSGGETIVTTAVLTTGYEGGGSGPGTGVVTETTTLVPITTVSGGETVVSTFITIGSGGDSVVATSTIISGGVTIVTSGPEVTQIVETGGGSGGGGGSGPGTGPGDGLGTGPGTGAGPTSYVLSFGTNTVTTTSISVSNIISTASVTISGPTVTTLGGTATVTQAGPTITASGGGGSGGGTVTVTEGNGPGGQVTVTAAPIIITSYILPSSRPSSSSSSICRTASTNYFNGRQLPGTYKRNEGRRSLFSPEGPRYLSEEQRMPRPVARLKS